MRTNWLLLEGLRHEGCSPGFIDGDVSARLSCLGEGKDGADLPRDVDGSFCRRSCRHELAEVSRHSDLHHLPKLVGARVEPTYYLSSWRLP